MDLTEQQAKFLNRVGEILKDPASRCTGAYARDKNGDPVAGDNDSHATIVIKMAKAGSCTLCLFGAAAKACAETAYDWKLTTNLFRHFFQGPGAFYYPADMWDQTDNPGRQAMVDKLLAAKAS